MGILIKNVRDIYIKFPLLICALVFLALSPIIVSILGMHLTEVFTAEPCHEGNCIWGALGWFAILTIPIAVFFSIILALIFILDLYSLYEK